MTKHVVEVDWKNNWVFEATQQGMQFPVGSSDVPGTTVQAFSPKQLLLVSLAGCTGVDMANLLPKMRVPFTNIVVKAEGVLTEETPRVYSTIVLQYIISAPETSREDIERAITMSTSKLCGVHAMLEKTARITHTLQLVQP